MILASTILVVLITLLLIGKINPTLIFFSASFLYLAFGFIDIQDWLRGYANESLLALTLLILLSSVFEKTTLINNISHIIIGKNYKSTLIRLGLVTSLTSAFLNNTAVVATFMKSIQNSKKNIPSTLLIPLSYFAIAGGTLTLIGTSTNLIVNSLAIQLGEKPMRFFSFTPIGVIVVITVFLSVYTFSFLLPKNQRQETKKHTSLIRCIISPHSSMIGRTIEECHLRNLHYLFLCEIWRDNMQLDPHKCVLQSGDQLYFSGDIRHIEVLSNFDGLEVEGKLECKNLKIVELVISPHSPLIGKSAKEVSFRTKFDAVIIAFNRGLEAIQKIGEERFMAGDHLILSIGSNFKTRDSLQNNFILISDISISQKFNQLNSFVILLGFFGAILLSAFGLFSLFQGLLFLVLIFFILGYIDDLSLKKHFPYTIFLTIGSSLCISQALIKSGVAPSCADFILAHLDNHGMYVTLIVVYFLTLFLTEIMTNNAAASLIFPLAYTIAQSLNIDFMPFALAVAFGASASFLTPYGYQTNLMISSLGSYRISDFLKIGWIISALYSAAVLGMIFILY